VTSSVTAFYIVHQSGTELELLRASERLWQKWMALSKTAQNQVA
jgi:hypothetical protein